MLVADALRLGGAILGTYPNMLAPQLVGRLLPEAPQNPAVASLLKQCHHKGKNHCALLPSHHCLHTPGGPLKYSLEGHQFAVFAFRLSSDKRHVVSISSRVISWDLSTSDLARDLCPQLEGIMQNLELSPDNKWAAASTNNSVVSETVRGVCVLNHHMIIYGPSSWVRYSMRGELQETCSAPDRAPYDDQNWEILSMEFRDLENFTLTMWSGDLDDDRILIQYCRKGIWMKPLRCRGAATFNRDWMKIYCSDPDRGYQISVYGLNEENSCWDKIEELHHQETDTAEAMLQLKRGRKDRMLLATTTYSFVVWDFNNAFPRTSPPKNVDGEDKEECEEEKEQQNSHEIEKVDEQEKDLRTTGIVLKLPHTIRNISTKMTQSNSFMISNNYTYAVAGVRKNLYVWSIETQKLIKVLDAHFGRIVQLEPLTVGSWNCVITSSIDRTVKIWNIDNIFEQVHKIDRQELPIDSVRKMHNKRRDCIHAFARPFQSYNEHATTRENFNRMWHHIAHEVCCDGTPAIKMVAMVFRLARDKQLAVSVTRSCWGLWNTENGKLLAQMADAPLGAIVTYAMITPNGDHVVTAESGYVIVWDTVEKKDKHAHRRIQPPRTSESRDRLRHCAGTSVRNVVWELVGGRRVSINEGLSRQTSLFEPQVLFKEEQKGIRQILLLEDGAKFITISMELMPDSTENLAMANLIARTIPEGDTIYSTEYEVRGVGYRAAVVSADEHHIVAPGLDKSSRDCLNVFHARTGTRLHRIPIKNSGIKDMQSVVALPHKPHWVAVVGNDKAGILDIKTKRHVRHTHGQERLQPSSQWSQCEIRPQTREATTPMIPHP
ncbi:NACHT and WD repeat domain-containing protein 2 [Eumeta japonica]|uniref:NACHT and WD repeat domain-containing protein 2 n=1 Tax=Eumeta variegata TaxID=151549 RepID=A0A4C1XSP3_EUMVA|nr:NACHT and WD repeat domain-containing protein 2 [Eumeta japonica]